MSNTQMMGVLPDRRAADAGRPPARETCTICASHVAVRPFYLTHGVRIALCSVHRDLSFLRRSGGMVLVRQLARRWHRDGGLTKRREAALHMHRRRVRSAGAANQLPGSYAWPTVRRMAERRFAKGEDPRQVIMEVRDLLAGHIAVAPSWRTMRRWFADGRWLHPKHAALSASALRLGCRVPAASWHAAKYGVRLAYLLANQAAWGGGSCRDPDCLPGQGPARGRSDVRWGPAPGEIERWRAILGGRNPSDGGSGHHGDAHPKRK